MTDLPQDLQDLYDHLAYVLRASTSPADAAECIDALDALVAPYRAAQSYAAGSVGPYRFLTAWSVWKTSDPASKVFDATGSIANPPTLMDLVLKAAEQESERT